MDSCGKPGPAELSPEAETALREVLGYLNFSSGKPDPKFQKHLNLLHEWLLPAPEEPPLKSLLQERLESLRTTSPAFQNSEQATAVLTLALDHVLPAYRRHHADLLFHLAPVEFYQPFFVARVFEATLTQGGPWDETERIVAGALTQLNDFLGHRPVAVLETGQKMQPYDHERFRPVPLYIRGAGAATGKYHDLIEHALEVLANTPQDILAMAHFDQSHLDELALDVRAYDHSHPVYKRTNYTFGEWDPHCLDVGGWYRRFVVRTIILDALCDWMEQTKELAPAEKLFEAAAVLAGTILMASAVSGAGPDTHDSNVNLTSLLPKIARQRDAFYTRLLQSLTGTHATRLRKESDAAQQPFGKIRQHLNLYLAHFGCRQLQRSHLAYLYAQMGFPDAAREQAVVIPSTATRFETELQWRITAAHAEIDRGNLPIAAKLVVEMEDLLHRGIACGAIVDPWNILGFQGQFPLFSAREDSVADQRVEKLLAIMDQLFAVYSRLLCEAAAAGDQGLSDALSADFFKLAEFWDQYATVVIADLPLVYGMENYESARQVTQALGEWYRAGEAAGDIAFWKKHVGEFQTAKAYAIIVDVLLRKQDILAAMNLLLQWLSQGDTVPLEMGAYSFHPLVLHWMDLVASKGDWPLIQRFFDYLEVNAGEYWTVPSFEEGATGLKLTEGDTGERELDELFAGDDEAADQQAQLDALEDMHDEDDEESLFDAAYDNVTFRDSAQDGRFSDTMDEGGEHRDTDLDLLADAIDQRTRFLVTLGQLWTRAAAIPPTNDATARAETIGRWFKKNESIERDLLRLVEALAAHQPQEPAGDPDSLIEYDRELHVKFGLLNSVISAEVGCHEVALMLRACLPEDVRESDPKGWERMAIHAHRLLVHKDAAEMRRLLPSLLKELSRRPLLYVPLDKGGRPRDILAARNLQSVLRMLLTHLPRLGLLRETWHVLRTAYIMERTAPPGGMSITEFDRLLQSSLRSSLECLIHSAKQWQDGKFPDQQLVELVGQLTEVYLRLWLKHSATMRLSSIEALKDPPTWKRVKAFIKDYGSDLFHTRVLTLGNLRAIVHRGADAYLDYLAENEDPLRPVKLLGELNRSITREEAVFHLELVFRCIVEKFDRFMEYNTTTTQSDYGEQLYCLLDFLRLEADYERQAWNLVPLVLAHEALSRLGKPEAAAMWQELLREKTAPLAKGHLQKLKKLEKQHGIRLPSITDRLNERFVKPLALDSILAEVLPAMRDSRARQPSEAFERLKQEVEEYLSTTQGSAMDLQPWLQSLADEVEQSEDELLAPGDADAFAAQTAILSFSPDDLRQQLEAWEKPLSPE